MPRPFHTLTIRRATAVVDDEAEIVYDDRGVATRTWADHLTLTGSNQPLTVEEVAQLSQGGPVAATHRIFLPGTPDVTEDDLIVDGGRTFQIDGVKDPAGARHHLEVLAHLVTDADLPLPEEGP